MGSPAWRADNGRRLLGVATSCCCLILAIQLTTTTTTAEAAPARKQMVRKCERTSDLIATNVPACACAVLAASHN